LEIQAASKIPRSQPVIFYFLKKAGTLSKSIKNKVKKINSGRKAVKLLWEIKVGNEGAPVPCRTLNGTSKLLFMQRTIRLCGECQAIGKNAFVIFGSIEAWILNYTSI